MARKRVPAAREKQLRDAEKRRAMSICVNEFNLTAARITDHATGIFVSFDMTFEEFRVIVDPKLGSIGATLNRYRPVGGTRTNPVYEYTLMFEIQELKEEEE